MHMEQRWSRSTIKKNRKWLDSPQKLYRLRRSGTRNLSAKHLLLYGQWNITHTTSSVAIPSSGQTHREFHSFSREATRSRNEFYQEPKLGHCRWMLMISRFIADSSSRLYEGENSHFEKREIPIGIGALEQGVSSILHMREQLCLSHVLKRMFLNRGKFRSIWIDLITLFESSSASGVSLYILSTDCPSFRKSYSTSLSQRHYVKLAFVTRWRRDTDQFPCVSRFRSIKPTCPPDETQLQRLRQSTLHGSSSGCRILSWIYRKLVPQFSPFGDAWSHL